MKQMSPGAITGGKAVVAATWLFCAAAVLGAIPAGGLATLGKVVFWLMIVAHLGEWFGMWQKVAREAGGSMPAHFAAVMVFGFLHGQTMQLAVAEKAGAVASETSAPGSEAS